MICWFDDRTNGERLALLDLVERIGIDAADQVDSGLLRIEQAQAAGYWVALVIEYEFGAWLEPALQDQDRTGSERLTAWVFKNACRTSLKSACTVVDESALVLSARSGMKHPDYIRMIAEIRDLIAAGEVYQINATFPLSVSTTGSAPALYQRLAEPNTAAHCAFIEDQHRGRHILSFSPELFVKREGHLLTTRPMKGTAPRVLNDPSKDQSMAKQLLASSKDRAENLMIVDLLRNDLGRIARPGSVRVDPLFALEAYPTVWTLTSTIQATLKPACTLADILRALFPCGSVTGAPKIAAMRHISRLESSPRGVYCGSIGWLAPGGDLSLNVAIRTLVLNQDNQGTYSVGGGIVYDSVAEQEWQECFWKARILGVDCET